MKIRLYKYLTVEALVAFVKNHSIKLSFGYEANDKFEMLPGFLNPTADTAKREREGRAIHKHGFISLSARADDAYMWGNYADKHMGACLELEFEVESGDENKGYYRRRERESRRSKLGSIEESYFEGEEIIKCGYAPNRIDKIDTTLRRCTEKIISNKYTGWSWEEEYRILYSTCERRARINPLLESIRAGNAIIYTTKDLNNNIIGINLSPLCPISLMDVKNGLEQDEELSGISVQRMGFTKGAYSLCPEYEIKDEDYIEAINSMRENDKTRILNLIKCKPYLFKKKDASRRTLLMHGVNMPIGEEIFEALIENSDIDAVDGEGKSALIHAVLRGRNKCLQCLLKKKADKNIIDSKGNTALDYAYYRRNIGCVRELLHGFGDVKHKHDDSRLIWSARYNLLEYLDVLLTRAGDLNAKDEYGRNALMWAARNGHDQCVKKIINKYIVLLNNDIVKHDTPTKEEKKEVKRCLLKFINQKDAEGRTALMLAAWKKSFLAVKYLIDQGADVNSLDNEGSTALIMALSSAGDKNGNDDKIVKLLISKGAEVDIKENAGLSAINYALYNGKKHCFELMLDKIQGKTEHFLLNKDENHLTMLDYAAAGGSIECVDTLLAALPKEGMRKLHEIYSGVEREENVNRSLICAFHSKKIDIINRFKQFGCSLDIKVQSEVFVKILCLSIEASSPELLEEVFKSSANMDALNFNDKNVVERISRALIEMVRCGYDSHMKIVLENLKKLPNIQNLSDAGGSTLLMWSVYKDSPELVEMLLKSSSYRDIQKRDSSGCNLLIWAARKGSVQCMRKIFDFVKKKNGIDSLRRLLLLHDFDGMTPLMYAAWKGNTECLDVLLNHESKDCRQITVTDRMQRSALDWAVAGENPECIKKLLEMGAKFGRTLEEEKRNNND